MTLAWMRRLHFHYHDPRRPDRLAEDGWGAVIALIVVLLYCLFSSLITF